MAVIGSLTAQGEFTGLQLAPPAAAEPIEPWEPADDVDTGRFDEEDVVMGSGPLAVPGTLSLPKSPKRCPGARPAGGVGAERPRRDHRA